MTEAPDYLSLDRAAELFPRRDGRLPTRQSIVRRIRRGVHGVRLRAVFSGGRWYTTAAWIEEFHAVSTAAACGTAKQERSPSFRRRHEAAAERLRRRYGLDVERAEVSDLRQDAESTRPLRRLLPGGVANGPER